VTTDATTIWSVENEEMFLADGSNTFHGRDRFAPVAAELAVGAAIATVGREVSRDTLQKLSYARPIYGEVSSGTIISIDRFGNAISDLELERIAPLDELEADVRGVTIRESAVAYGQAPPNTPFLIGGSRGTVEVSVANASAAELLQLARFDRISLRKRVR
jgi:S-adenosylmethionine hydrolase